MLNLLYCSRRKFSPLFSDHLFYKIIHMLASLYFSVTMVPSVCPHGWKPSSDLEMIDAAGATHRPLLLCCGLPPFGELSFCPCLWLRVSKTLSRAHLSVRSRGGSGWVPHSPTLVQCQPAALHVHPLLLSPSLEIDHDDGSKSLQPL